MTNTMKIMTENQIRMNLGFNFQQCLAAWVLSYFILSSSGEMKQSFYESQGWDSTPLRARQEELRRLAGEESKEVKELTRAIAYCEERGWDSKALEARLEAAYARGG